MNRYTIALTGKLSMMKRNDAKKLIEALNWTFQSSVTSSTNILVVGIIDLNLLEDKTTTKIKQATELLNSGKDIRLIPEREFFELVQKELQAKSCYI